LQFPWRQTRAAVSTALIRRHAPPSLSSALPEHSP
jgi:hypothetical protein